MAAKSAIRIGARTGPTQVFARAHYNGFKHGRTAEDKVFSRTADLHGNLYYFGRNEVLGANNFFANLTGVPRGEFRRSQPGSTLGGSLPWANKRAFFFVSCRAIRDGNAASLASSVRSAEPPSDTTGPNAGFSGRDSISALGQSPSCHSRIFYWVCPQVLSVREVVAHRSKMFFLLPSRREFLTSVPSCEKSALVAFRDEMRSTEAYWELDMYEGARHGLTGEVL